MNDCLSPSKDQFVGVALVTGAAGVVGPGVVNMLKQAGWLVAAADYNEECFKRHESLYREPAPGDCLLVADLRNREECFRLVDEVVCQLGAPKLLVNCATGHTRKVALPFNQFDEKSSRQTLEVDLLAPLFLVQAAIESLSANRGLVVNLSSVRTQENAPGTLLYSAAKAALETMTKGLAVELAPYGVRVNCIRLGSIPGPELLENALRLLPDDLARRLRQEVMAEIVNHSPEPSLTGRAGLPSDVGSLILYLLSEPGTFINGAVIPLDGGYLLAKERRGKEAPSKSFRYWRTTPHVAVKEWLSSRNLAEFSF